MTAATIFLALALVFLAGGCTAVHDAVHVSESKRIIKQYLMRPSSAQFRRVSIFVARAPIVCGEVRARRANGTFGPWRRFFSASYDGLAGIVHDNEDIADLQGGLDLTPYSEQDWTRDCDRTQARGQ